MSSGPHGRIDLDASAQRIQSSQKLAAEQARLVEAADGKADNSSIDLFYILQESVLVFTETHRMLEKLHERECRLEAECKQAARTAADKTRLQTRRALLAAKVVALAIFAAFMLELIDPAPMDVRARSHDTTQRPDRPQATRAPAR